MLSWEEMGRTTAARNAGTYYFTHAMTLTEKLSRLKALNIMMLFDEVLKENEDELVEMNRSQMYDDGVMDVNNPSKKEKYALSTKLAKRRAPFPKTNFITLKWKGDFHSSLKLIILKDTFIISSNNLTWANFLEPQNRFASALGMTAKNQSELRELSRDELIKKIRNVT
jgi:hypothetical protein